MTDNFVTLDPLRENINAAARQAGTTEVRLVAASKTRPTGTTRACAAAGQHAFGENDISKVLAK